MCAVELESVFIIPVYEGIELIGIVVIPLVELFGERLAEDKVIVSLPVSGIYYFFLEWQQIHGIAEVVVGSRKVSLHNAFANLRQLDRKSTRLNSSHMA